MKKEKNWPLGTEKPHPVYKYELKDINQILKDTVHIRSSSPYSSTLAQKDKNLQVHDFEASPFGQNSGNRLTSLVSRLDTYDRSKRPYRSNDFLRQSSQKKLFQQVQYSQSSINKQFLLQDKGQKGKKQEELEGNPVINSWAGSFGFENQNCGSGKANILLEKGMQTSFGKTIDRKSRKEIKRQGRGLADISARVKAIVARKGNMSFKEVSDEVLKEFQGDLPANLDQKEKEMKNIRRRVYDALNVLVQVGVLEKEGRRVVYSEMESRSGKKLFEHDDIISEKNRILSQQESNYNKKLANLSLLRENYQMVLSFHERNKKFNDLSGKKQESTRSQLRQQSNCNAGGNKFHFPLMFLIPPQEQTNKINIEMEHDEEHKDFIRKFKIEGNDYTLLTDLEMLKYVDMGEQKKAEEPVMNREIAQQSEEQLFLGFFDKPAQKEQIFMEE